MSVYVANKVYDSSNKETQITDRLQPNLLFRAWPSCADRNCQDNINTEIEIKRRWHRVLQEQCP